MKIHSKSANAVDVCVVRDEMEHGTTGLTNDGSKQCVDTAVAYDCTQVFQENTLTADKQSLTQVSSEDDLTESENTDNESIKSGISEGTCQRKRVKDHMEDQKLLKRIRGDVPPKMFEATVGSMQAGVFKICSKGGLEAGIFPLQSLDFFRKALKPEYIISEINPSDGYHSVENDDIFTTHREITVEHMSEIESGGINGLRRVVGAILQTGKSTLKILCAEVYARDTISDPHAESENASPSSIPIDSEATQYKARIKITLVHDRYKRNKLVIGARACNYLITSGLYKNNDKSQGNQTFAFVGPNRCAAFKVDRSTKMFIKNEVQDPGLLSSDILGLAQVRSGFGHPTTYTARREALLGYGSLYLTPVTIFSLSQYKVPLSLVFRSLAIRARQNKEAKITLHFCDIEEPQQDDHSEAANITRRLLGLFPGSRELVVTGNEEAEKVLSDLSNEFSKAISNKNLKVAKKILSEIL
ncbi:hypothetical protein BX616_000888 [Lobosporangium transversale]|uniref:Uncharacterized protein n=1 Tax=Lobosporangium transversale TaxID=64571 RepID=A0A1Y2GMH0_9FUNG|nr:hypothetical protein BCR41DRAFT_396502 [Lobosporangium transversale]KAF9905910.1 hypothetical protein BX616_000888 [Lobosporangium transversale]ORZ15539.1 hypothetical protein BCR41DRAFT_396502 [Lobosporangium transversale]|eukprot:XP_021881287.1 hypothetical protein BCR41DRAFT_396502 [Lobosporangium transversale]